MSDVAESNVELSPVGSEGTGIALEAPKAAPKKKVAKKAPAAAPVTKKAPTKKVAKAAVKKAPAPVKKAKAAKKEATGVGRPKKEGLRKPQVRILAALKKANRGLSRAEIAEKAPVDVATCVEYIGSLDQAKREANDVKMGWKSLISLKYVKQAASEQEDARGAYYTITEAGKSALEKAEKAAK